MAKLLSDASAKWIIEQRKKVTSAASRAVRTPFVAAGGFLGWRQWHCSIVDGNLRLRSGSLAWGGGHYAVWPSGRTVSRSNFGTISGEVPEGGTRFVVWFTKCYPCPVAHCPKAPNGNTECPAPGGNPATWKADAGEITLLATPERGEGWTDFHVLATVSRDGDSYTINQIQTAEIAVNAIVYPGEEGEESDDEDDDDEDKDCSAADNENFPSTVDGVEGPKDPEDEDGGGDEDEEKFPSKIDVCW